MIMSSAVETVVIGLGVVVEAIGADEALRSVERGLDGRRLGAPGLARWR